MAAPDAHGNVTLLVSNQSFEINPVDIELAIDGQVVVQDEFDVQGDQPPQHNWHQFRLQLADGPHGLVAKSARGQARQQATFEVPDVQTVAVAYWHDRQGERSEPEGYFTVEFQPGQIATM
jgi:hypothetical protein